MAFLKHELKLPLTTPPPPQTPPSRHRLKVLGWGFCLISLVILHLIFFLTITFPTIFSLLPHPPTFHLISAEINVTSLTAGDFSGDWKLDFNISNPPNGPYISFTPISASVISPSRHVILADTHDVVTTTRGSAPTTTGKADVIEAQARIFSPPNQTLDGAVLKRILDDRAHGFVKFDVEIKVNVVFARSLPAVPISIPDTEREYKVDCKGLEFYFADEEGKKGVAKIAPGMCELNYPLEEVIATLAYVRHVAS